MKRIVILTFALLLVAAVSQATRVDPCACGRPAQVPVSFVVRDTDSRAAQADVESMSIWNQYVDVFRQSAQPGNYGLGNGVSEVYVVDLTDVLGMDGASFLGYTGTVPESSFGNFNECPIPAGTACGGAITESDVMMNSTVPWQLTRPAVGELAAYYHATATHEFGHVLGFHHNWQNFSEMNYLPHFARFLSRADVVAARQQFPGSVKAVADLATYGFTYNENGQTNGDDGGNAIAVASVSPASVAAGGKITIKNYTIENLSTGPLQNVALLFFLSKDQNITPQDVLLDGFLWDSFSTWADDPTGTQFTVPAGTPAGAYYVGALVGTLNGNTVNMDTLTYNNTWVVPTPISVGGGSGAGPTTCTPSETTLCLSGKRFSVSVNWAHAGTPGGVGHTMTLTDSSGLFWFSSADNIEMLVKVLDACGFNNRIWVFGAAATSLQFDLTVLDNHTGKTKVYHNDDNNKAVAITDVGAFATCGQ